MLMYLVRRFIIIVVLLLSCKMAYGAEEKAAAAEPRTMLSWVKKCMQGIPEYDRSISAGGQMGDGLLARLTALCTV